MSDRRVTHELYPKQRLFIESLRRNLLLRGGRGSGKTQAGAMWAETMLAKHPDKPGLIAANTYKQLSRFTLKKLFALLALAGIAFVHGRRPPASWGVRPHFPTYDGVLTLVNGAQAITSQLTNYDDLRGADLAWGWLDETRDTDPEAIAVVLGCFRGFGEEWKYPLRVTTTPNGFDHVWARFSAEPSEGAMWPRLPDSADIQVSTRDNVFEPGFADRLIGNYSNLQGLQEVEGDYVNLQSGRAFAFRRESHVGTPPIRSDLPLSYSMDFNVSPLCGVVFQLDRKARSVAVIDEIVLPDDGLTASACTEFARRYREVEYEGTTRKFKPAVRVYGDIAGKHRDTRGGESDIMIMVKTLKQSFASVADHNDYCQRFVSDGVNAINALLDPADKSAPRLIVHKRCTLLIRDLEQVSWKPGTREIDKGKNKQLTHLTDALRYPIAQELPVTGDPLPASFAPRGLYA